MGLKPLRGPSGPVDLRTSEGGGGSCTVGPRAQATLLHYCHYVHDHQCPKFPMAMRF